MASDNLSKRLSMYKVVAYWNRLIDPVRFAEVGEEPQIPELAK